MDCQKTLPVELPGLTQPSSWRFTETAGENIPRCISPCRLIFCGCVTCVFCSEFNLCPPEAGAHAVLTGGQLVTPQRRVGHPSVHIPAMLCCSMRSGDLCCRARRDTNDKH